MILLLLSGEPEMDLGPTDSRFTSALHEAQYVSAFVDTTQYRTVVDEV